MKKYVVIHCSDSPFGDAAEINEWHRERGFKRGAGRNGFGSIGYQYVILNEHPQGMHDNRPDLDGAIQVGRDEDEVGAHAIGLNNSAIGICLIGWPGQFTRNQLMSMRALAASIAVRNKIPIEKVIGHYETPHEQAKSSGRKTCPGIDMNIERAEIGKLMRALEETR